MFCPLAIKNRSFPMCATSFRSLKRTYHPHSSWLKAKQNCNNTCTTFQNLSPKDALKHAGALCHYFKVWQIRRRFVFLDGPKHVLDINSQGVHNCTKCVNNFTQFIGHTAFLQNPSNVPSESFL